MAFHCSSALLVIFSAVLLVGLSGLCSYRICTGSALSDEPVMPLTGGVRCSHLCLSLSFFLSVSPSLFLYHFHFICFPFCLFFLSVLAFLSHFHFMSDPSLYAILPYYVFLFHSFSLLFLFSLSSLYPSLSVVGG